MNLLVVPGDGIGPDISAATMEVVPPPPRAPAVP
jgi:isocitrate/isopropylmalate dehydrogenase